MLRRVYQHEHEFPQGYTLWEGVSWRPTLVRHPEGWWAWRWYSPTEMVAKLNKAVEKTKGCLPADFLERVERDSRGRAIVVLDTESIGAMDFYFPAYDQCIVTTVAKAAVVWENSRQQTSHKLARHAVRACRLCDKCRAWKQRLSGVGQDVHHFEQGFLLGWKWLDLNPAKAILESPYNGTKWETDKLWADRYSPDDSVLHAPGVHAHAFYTMPSDTPYSDAALALVAGLGHATIGDKTWRAEGAQLVRVWIAQHVLEEYRHIKMVPTWMMWRYGVQVNVARGIEAAALSWAARRLMRGCPLLED